MDEYRRNVTLIQDAVNRKCAALQPDPGLTQRILRQAEQKEAGKMKRKMPLVLAFILVLLLMGSTALAVALLSPQALIDQTVLPMAEKSGSYRDIPNFTQEELQTILAVAEENGIRLSDYWYDALKAPQGVYKDSLIMALATAQFGEYLFWTIEEQYWFGEVMVRLGLDTENLYCLPSGEEITYEEAYARALDFFRTEYEDDVSDRDRWTMAVEYSWRDFEAGDGRGDAPHWWFQFTPTSLEDCIYTVILTTDGEVESYGGSRFPMETWLNVEDAYRKIYGSVDRWSPGTWAAFGRDLEKTEATTSTWAWAYKASRYIDPPADAIDEEQAEKIALETVALDYTEVFVTICCMDGETPIWKVVTHTLRPEDMGSGQYTATWMVEMDVMTGQVRDVTEWRMHETPAVEIYIPRSVAAQME